MGRGLQHERLKSEQVVFSAVFFLLLEGGVFSFRWVVSGQTSRSSQTSVKYMQSLRWNICHDRSKLVSRFVLTS